MDLLGISYRLKDPFHIHPKQLTQAMLDLFNQLLLGCLQSGAEFLKQSVQSLILTLIFFGHLPYNRASAS